MNNTTPYALRVCSWSQAGNAFPLCKTAVSQECCQMKMNAVTRKFNVCAYSEEFFQC